MYDFKWILQILITSFSMILFLLIPPIIVYVSLDIKTIYFYIFYVIISCSLLGYVIFTSYKSNKYLKDRKNFPGYTEKINKKSLLLNRMLIYIGFALFTIIILNIVLNLFKTFISQYLINLLWIFFTVLVFVGVVILELIHIDILKYFMAGKKLHMTQDELESILNDTKVLISAHNRINNSFDLIEKIGEGASAIVYKGKDLRTLPNLGKSQTVAIKIIKPEILKEENEERRIRREFEICSTISHQNIIKIFKTGLFYSPGIFHSRDNLFYLVLEYIPGKQTLETIRDSKTILTEKKLINFILQICEGLKILHQRGIIHRDIKPGNIMIHESCLKVMDLGIAKDINDKAFTKSHYFLGTLRYSAPEAILGEKVSFKTDLYALGAIMYELITKKVIFEEVKNRYRLSNVIQSSGPMPIDEVNPNNIIHENLKQLTMKLLSRNPADRPSDVKYVIQTLEKVNSN